MSRCPATAPGRVETTEQVFVSDRDGERMRVLGVDPGLTRCGIGVIDGMPGRALTLVATDVICTPSGDDIALRLLALEEGIERWLTEHKPDACSASTTSGR
jgi:crossover junction endodeoxyribonuclease RuvC